MFIEMLEVVSEKSATGSEIRVGTRVEYTLYISMVGHAVLLRIPGLRLCLIMIVIHNTLSQKIRN